MKKWFKSFVLSFLLVVAPVWANHENRFSDKEIKKIAQQSYALNIAQWEAAKKQIAGVDTPKLWLVTVGMSAESLAFDGDVEAIKRFFKGVDGEVVSLSYSNLIDGKKVRAPLAYPQALAQDFAKMADLVGANDKVLLLISTHGSVGELSANIMDWYGSMSDDDLQAALKPLANTPTTLILSACHSGSFIGKLKRDNRIILTSAASDRSSFGCQFESDNTWFIKALLQNDDRSVSIKSLFDSANKQVTQWEVKEDYTPSKPQVFIGKDSEKWANQPIEQWLHY